MLRARDYEGAAAQFRLSEDETRSLLGRFLALVAQGKDEAASRSIRRAVRREPDLVRRKLDLAAEYRDAKEYGKVVAALERRAAAVPGNADAKFALAVVRYYAGDRRCTGTFAWLVEVTPTDGVADLFDTGARARWPRPAKADQEKRKRPSSEGRREGAKK
jgi:hypothetical protein